jgi:Lipopolysaccharide-assembly
MSLTKSLILLFSLASLFGCGYTFVLKGSGNLGQVSILPSSNQTSLRGANMVLDSNLENKLAAMGVFSHQDNLPRLRCTIVSSSSQEITSNRLAANRFRLTLTVKAEIVDLSGKVIWQAHFADDGYYASGGQEENALEDACQKIADRIAQAIGSIKI